MTGVTEILFIIDATLLAVLGIMILILRGSGH